jgi:CheY-like chemotaxis protein
VSLKILFADDSMTAQNMGKKILTGAGYEVVAVSNGAAAVKKIAEQKPDIIILDIYMPGYSGLEVCEKVRGSLDTVKTPVLLTVGKMEPYKLEDANRVKADGVIIKPFEASDLLAIVKKFEERIANAQVPPMVEQTLRLESQYQEETIAALPEPPTDHQSTGRAGMQPMVEVPDHMAGSAAFTDLLGTDSASVTPPFAVNTPAAAFETSVIEPAPPVPAADYELPVLWEEEEKAEPIAATPVESAPEVDVSPVAASPEPVAAVAEPEPEMSAVPVEAEPEVAASPVAASPEPVVAEPEPEVSAVPVEASEPEPPHPQFIPVFKEPEPEAAAYEVVPTAAPPTDEMEIPREPGLQERAEETTRNTVADHLEPGLMSMVEQQVAGFPATHVEEPASTPSASGEANAAGTAETVPEVSDSVLLSEIDATSEVSDSDFEARVAAAMAAYNHAAEAAPEHVPTTEGPVTVTAEAAPPTSVYTVQAVAEPAPSFEYHPPVNVPEPLPAAHIASEPAEVAAEPVPPAPEPVAPEPAAVVDAITAAVEAAAIAAAAETQADHNTITQAVHRVMERLKPELVEEIMRELRSKK